jgi:RimJ/RimL family protein N-acetyltransferase
MAITVTCPECGQVMKLKEELIGKKIGCLNRDCSHSFLLKATMAEPERAAPKPPPLPRTKTTGAAPAAPSDDNPLADLASAVAAVRNQGDAGAVESQEMRDLAAIVKGTKKPAAPPVQPGRLQVTDSLVDALENVAEGGLQVPPPPKPGAAPAARKPAVAPPGPKAPEPPLQYPPSVYPEAEEDDDDGPRPASRRPSAKPAAPAPSAKPEPAAKSEPAKAVAAPKSEASKTMPMPAPVKPPAAAGKSSVPAEVLSKPVKAPTAGWSAGPVIRVPSRINGTSVYLRPLRLEDLDAFAGLLDDSEASRTHTAVRMLAAARASRDEETLEQPTAALLMGTCLKDDDRLIGVVGLFDIDLRNRSARFEILFNDVARKVAGKGFRTDAVRAMVEHGFRELGLHRQFVMIHDNQPLGRKPLELVGFVEEGRLRQAYFYEGKHWDILMWGLLAAEYFEAKRAAANRSEGDD